jgi:hypothetical protein
MSDEKVVHRYYRIKKWLWKFMTVFTYVYMTLMALLLIGLLFLGMIYLQILAKGW